MTESKTHPDITAAGADPADQFKRFLDPRSFQGQLPMRRCGHVRLVLLLASNGAPVFFVGSRPMSCYSIPSENRRSTQLTRLRPSLSATGLEQGLTVGDWWLSTFHRKIYSSTMAISHLSGNCVSDPLVFSRCHKRQ